MIFASKHHLQIQELQDQLNTVEDNLDKEIADREEADQAIRDDINKRIDEEVAKLLAANQATNEKLDKEIQDRTEADTNLQNQITNLDQKFEDWKENDFSNHIKDYEALKEAHDNLKEDYDQFKADVTASLTLQLV